MMLAACVVATNSQAQTVALGANADADLKGFVRYRAFNNGNQGVQVSDPSGTTSANLASWGTSKCVQITYNGSNTLTTRVANVASPCAFTTPIVTVPRNVALGTSNYLEIEITKNTNTTSIAFEGVLLTPPGAPGGSLGNFSLASPAAGPLVWSVSDIDLSSGFTLVAMLVISGSNGGGDSNFVEVRLGELPPSDTEGPVTSNVHVTPMPVLLNGSATVEATVSDVTTGGNTVLSAEYSLNGGAWVAMDAGDGTFDEVEEDVEASFTATQLGTNEVCVRGMDVLGNLGSEICQPFLVTYKFAGFFSPVDNDVVNVAKAGQAIPYKWRLTDANDLPIGDPASFAGLFASVLACSGAEPTDAVEEEAAGNSGLQYDGDGYWQFNWKTPKIYATTCQGAYVLFNSGATSPVVKVQFKK